MRDFTSSLFFAWRVHLTADAARRNISWNITYRPLSVHRVNWFTKSAPSHCAEVRPAHIIADGLAPRIDKAEGLLQVRRPPNSPAYPTTFRLGLAYHPLPRRQAQKRRPPCCHGGLESREETPKEGICGRSCRTATISSLTAAVARAFFIKKVIAVFRSRRTRLCGNLDEGNLKAPFAPTR
jgi:hypothetical protein